MSELFLAIAILRLDVKFILNTVTCPKKGVKTYTNKFAVTFLS